MRIKLFEEAYKQIINEDNKLEQKERLCKKGN